jgi:hypothetical protein
LAEALAMIGAEQQGVLLAALLAGDVRARLRHEDGTTEELKGKAWVNATIDWPMSLLRIPGKLIGVFPSLDEVRTPDRWVLVEVELKTLLTRFPDAARRARGGRKRLPRESTAAALQAAYAAKHGDAATAKKFNVKRR